MVDNGDGPRPSSPSEVIQGWQTTLSPLDAVYHQVNQYIITLTVRACLDVYVCVPGSDSCRRVGARIRLSHCHIRLSGSARAGGWVSLMMMRTRPRMCMERTTTCLCVLTTRPYLTHMRSLPTFMTGPEQGAGNGLRLGDALQGERPARTDADVRGPLQL